MARKKFLDEEDSENVNKHHHHASNTNHALLHDNTNIKLGHHQQQKPPLNSPATKNVVPSHKKGNKYKNSGSGKANVDDSFGAVMSQLSSTGLTLREMPGDGNCLFRALADQLEGNSRNHMDHRRAVVDFMRKNRPDFEPFVEDDEPFEKYIQGLAQNGTFAGNDAIVAFARLHNVTVVIHQLNSPAWLIHPSNEASYSPSGREIHIAYHNGDHYNSVRKLGDDSETPANIKLGLQGHSVCASKGVLPNSNGKSSPPHSTSSLKPQAKSLTPEVSEYNAAQETMYESLLYGRRDEDYWVKDASDIDRLVSEVMEQTDCCDPTLVREALTEFHFDITSTVDYILSMSYFIMSQPEPQDELPQPDESVSNCQDEENSAVPKEVCPSPNAPADQISEEPAPQPTESSTFTVSNKSPPHVAAETAITLPDNQSSPSPALATESIPGGLPTTSLVEGRSPKHSSQIQNLENVGPKSSKVKATTRQKKELKKKERKREANQRKLAENVDKSTPSIAQSSNLGSLNI